MNADIARADLDLVVILGASMGPDYTRFRDPDLIRPGEQTIVQIDVDPRNAGWVYPVDEAISGVLVALACAQGELVFLFPGQFGNGPDLLDVSIERDG